jgi:hypothetical protein
MEKIPNRIISLRDEIRTWNLSILSRRIVITGQRSKASHHRYVGRKNNCRQFTGSNDINPLMTTYCHVMTRLETDFCTGHRICWTLWCSAWLHYTLHDYKHCSVLSHGLHQSSGNGFQRWRVHFLTYNISARTIQKTPFLCCYAIVRFVHVETVIYQRLLYGGTCGRCLATGLYTKIKP